MVILSIQDVESDNFSKKEFKSSFQVSAVAAYNRLYAVGGVNSVGRLSSVECYCVGE